MGKENRTNKPPYFYARHADGTEERVESLFERFRKIAPRQLRPIVLEESEITKEADTSLSTTESSPLPIGKPITVG